MTDHAPYMQAALALARRNLGQTWPNPAVGAVVVQDGRIVGEGSTARGGRPHAETQALAQAGDKARGATLYVTLEPCCHHGQTPPCTDAIIASGIARCIIACRDPHPQVAGQGIAQLQQAGIEVTLGVGEAEARDINRGFFSWVEKQRPYVALKIATSQDGKIAFPLPNPPPQAGEGIKWITGEAARRHGHLLRSRFDAIATGIGTVLADDPLLTCRLPGLEDKSPVRVVFDRHGRLPKDSQLVKTADEVPVWVLCHSEPQAKNLKILHYAQDDNKTDDIGAALALLAGEGITRLLVEGGQALTTAFLDSGRVDTIYWFRAPITIGDKGMDAVQNGDLPQRIKAQGFVQADCLTLGDDVLEVYERR